MLRKSLIAISLILVVSLILGPAAAADDTPEIGLAMIDLTSGFFIEMMEAGDEAAEDFDVNLTWSSAEESLEDQLSIIETFIEDEKDVILIDPIDAEAVKPVIEEAYNAGIHVITMGNFVDTPYNINTLYNDYEDMKTITEIAAAWYDYEGNVVFINMEPGNYVSDQRQAGFEDGMAQFDNFNTLDIQPAGWDPVRAMDVTEGFLVSYDDIDALISATDGNTLAAIEVLRAEGRLDDIGVFSYDGNPEALERVKEGEMLVNLLTGSKRVGYWNVMVAAELARGEEFDQKIYLPTHFVLEEETVEILRDKGYDVDEELHSWVTAEEALALFDGYREELGPK